MCDVSERIAIRESQIDSCIEAIQTESLRIQTESITGLHNIVVFAFESEFIRVLNELRAGLAESESFSQF